MQFLDNYRYLKGANEVNRWYFQHPVLLRLLKALYYDGYAPILHVSYYMPKIMQNLPRSIQDLIIIHGKVNEQVSHISCTLAV